MPRTLTDDDVEAIAQRVAVLVIAATKPGETIVSDRFYSVEAACAALGVHPETLTRWFRAGVIKGNRKLGHWRMRGADLLKCV